MATHPFLKENRCDKLCRRENSSNTSVIFSIARPTDIRPLQE